MIQTNNTTNNTNKEIVNTSINNALNGLEMPIRRVYLSVSNGYFIKTYVGSDGFMEIKRPIKYLISTKNLFSEMGIRTA
jgi:hypothetical protein